MNNDLELTKTSSFDLSKFLYLCIKRFFDIIISLIGIIVMLPLIVLIKIAYIMTGDFNSIFYSQNRIGKNGKLFKLYKFRTMVPNADKVLERILKKDRKLFEEYRVNKKLAHDPRITKVGRIIRRVSIDEMPQMINVLFGQMSIIGNRPYLPREKEDMRAYYNDIIRTKPGLSGLWQTSGRSNTTFLRRCKLEADYSKKANLWLDIKLFFKTFLVIFKGL